MSEPVFLYVEDDKMSRSVMKMLINRILKYEDYTVFADSSDFMDRVHALEKIPTIIFLDIQIGPIDGYEMLELLRSDAAYENSKVIAMTANVMSHDVEALREAGFTGLIGKPIIKEIFPELVEKILGDEQVWYVP